MEIDSVCGCKITLTTEDLDKNFETSGRWMIAKVMEHFMWEHTPTDQPITREQVNGMKADILRGNSSEEEKI
jgi:hypothetical protein